MLVSVLTIPAQAFNSIHFNSYNLVPTSIYFTTLNLSSGLYLEPNEPTTFSLPVSAVLNLAHDFELGAGIKTHWGRRSESITHIVMGTKIGLTGYSFIQADLLLATQNSANGFSITYLKITNVTAKFINYSQFKFGLMNHFASDALLAFEAGFYPTLKIVKPIGLQLGFVSSSQSAQFENNLAIDFLPTLLVNVANATELSVSLVMGLAGNHQSDLALHVVFELSL